MKTTRVIGAGILALCPKTGRMLLGRRGMNGDDPNCWATFGGTFEDVKDSDPKQTARREFKEETSYSGPLTLFKTPIYINDNNHIIFYNFVAIVPEEFEPVINYENLDSGWFHLGQTPENLHPGFKELLEKKHKTLQNILKHDFGF